VKWFDVQWDSYRFDVFFGLFLVLLPLSLLFLGYRIVVALVIVVMIDDGVLFFFFLAGEGASVHDWGTH
jgi:hypothetical protein